MPLDREHRDRRRQAIVEILRANPVENQKELLSRLRERGIEVTQSSVSRDLKDLGATRVEGVYDLPSWAQPPDTEFERVRGFVKTVHTAGPHQTLVTTDAGAARLVAHAIDLEKWPEAVGTLAGDDTFLIFTKEIGHQKLLLQRFKTFLEGD
ncbi:MAG TPA: arginine repressor [Thermoanaerobaculia bacterium]|nr:arginine repressor [Thermoanaerobaculia bacterium]